MLAKLYNPVMKPLDRVGFRDWRAWVTADACGRVLEIGVGTGLNFSYYDSCAEVIAFDPDAEMLIEIEAEAGVPGPLRLLQARAEHLPFPDEHFDAAIGTLVFCTIPDPEAALREIRRVVKPGASLRLVEHVRGRHPLVGGVQRLATPLWKRFSGGCHLDRDTLKSVRAAGWRVMDLESKYRGLLIGIVAVKS